MVLVYCVSLVVFAVVFYVKMGVFTKDEELFPFLVSDSPHCIGGRVASFGWALLAGDGLGEGVDVA